MNIILCILSIVGLLIVIAVTVAAAIIMLPDILDCLDEAIECIKERKKKKGENK